MAESSTPKSKSATFLVAVGTASLMLTRWAWRSIGLISTAVLARYLMPDDFGLVAIGLAYVSLLENLSELGGRTALIRHGAGDPKFVDTVFTLQLARGLLIAGIVVASSFLLPQLTKDHRLQPVIWCLALLPVLDGLQNPRVALFERELSFWREVVQQLSSKILSTATAITIAILFQSYWALVAGALVQGFSKVVLSYIFSASLPKLSIARWRTLLQFSGWLSAAYAVNSIGTGLDNLIVGGIVSVRAAGLYDVARQLATMPLGELLPVIARTLFPALLQFKDEPQKLRDNTLEALAIVGGISLPVAFGFAFVAPEFVRIIYGQRWLDAIVLVQWMAIADGIASLDAAVAYSVGMATGRTDLLFRRALIVAIIRLPAFIAGTWLFGLQGAVGAYVIGSAVWLIVNLDTVRISAKCTFAAIARALWRAIAATLLMAGVLAMLQSQLDSEGTLLGSAAALAVKVFAGVLAYAGGRLGIWWLSGKADPLEARMRMLAQSLRRRAA